MKSMPTITARYSRLETQIMIDSDRGGVLMDRRKTKTRTVILRAIMSQAMFMIRDVSCNTFGSIFQRDLIDVILL